MFENLSRFFGRTGRSSRASADAIPHISNPPHDAKWRKIRPQPDNEPVRATLASHDGSIQSERGSLSYRAGAHYIVHYGDGDRAPVARQLFERTYRERADGRYEKRTDIVLRYFTLKHAVYVDTLEGARYAAPGDWIVEGVTGELWPVEQSEAVQKYDQV